jgi:hypothetical protein
MPICLCDIGDEVQKMTEMKYWFVVSAGEPSSTR